MLATMHIYWRHSNACAAAHMLVRAAGMHYICCHVLAQVISLVGWQKLVKFLLLLLLHVDGVVCDVH